VGHSQGSLQGGQVLKAVAFVGWSGSGKTTLIESLLPHLAEWQIGYLKSDVHGLLVDPRPVPTLAPDDPAALARFVAEPLLG